MRLRKLVLHGFKSFADRTEFVFDAPITGIVGPNGCGKSNVVDAFKWVLGEQSAKSLRGDAMLDVIFNGASTRKPAGLAEVVLVFENPRRADGTRLLPLEADEVSVGRRLYRDGTSEYSLNNKGSRLKDIRELFLDTGVGVDAYSVIEQGRVAQLLDANPQERRSIFEEAAGISKFKARKKEAQRKLEKVDQNLLRVTDIVDEVERRLRGVRVQAGRARVFQEHNTRLAEIRLDYALNEYHGYAGELKTVEGQITDAKFRLDDATAEVTRAGELVTEKRDAHQAATGAKQNAEYELVELGGQIERARQAEQFATRQLSQISEQLKALEEEGAASGQRLATAREHLEKEQARLAELTAEVQARQAEINAKQEAFKQGQLRLNQLSQEQERQKAALLDAMRRHAQTSSRLDGIEIERRNTGQQQQRLEQRRGTLEGELAQHEQRKAELDERLKFALEEIAARQSEADGVKAEAQLLGKQLSELTEQLSSAKEQRSALTSRQKVLTDLENRQQGVAEGVKSVLRRREKDFPFVRGLVADVLKVDIEHARVIEAALDGRDQWLVVTSIAEATARAEALAKLEGRVNFVTAEPWPASAFDRACAEQVAAGAGEPAGREVDEAFYIRHPTSDLHHYAEELAASPVPVRLAMDLVRFEPQFGPVVRRLLSRVAVVEDLAAAEQLRLVGPHGWRYVTGRGEVLDSDGTLHAGPPSVASGILSRRSELEQLAQQLHDAERRIAELTEQLASSNQQAKSLEARQSELRNAVFQANTRKVETSSQLSQVNDRINHLRREQPLLDRELGTLAQQLEKLVAEEQTLVARKAEIEAQQAAAQQAADQALEQHKALADEMRGAGEALAASRVAIAEFQQKQIASRQQEQRLSSQISELVQQLARLESQSDQLVAQREEATREFAGAKHKQEALGEQREQLKARVAELAEKVQSLSSELAGVEKALESARLAASEVEAELNRFAVREGELKVRVETLISRTRDELAIELAAKYEELSSVEGEGGGYVPPDRDWAAIAKEIAELKDKIHRLGNVNVDAIAEQDELESRSTFLSKELTDLRESKLQLEKLIEEINAESSVRFTSTFEAVREHFQGMFRKLFGGGKADLYLETELEPKQQNITVTNPDGSITTQPAPMIKVDPLDAGIEVIARPPGKQPVSISQLSGGEKTMTCVALLLSIFKSKPSPFCILDEVDAALDEANNQRFNLIVKEFLDQSQFIIITHSKRTMTIADQLYGVTQQEQGVSRRVAVKFDQVGRDGKIDQAAVREQEARDKAQAQPVVEVLVGKKPEAEKEEAPALANVA